MEQNPYQSSRSPGVPTRTTSTRWLVWTGVACLALAMMAAAGAVVNVVLGFQAIAQSSDPSPEALARRMSLSSLLLFGAPPFGLTGIVLLILGLVLRRPMEDGPAAGRAADDDHRDHR